MLFLFTLSLKCLITQFWGHMRKGGVVQKGSCVLVLKTTSACALWQTVGFSWWPGCSVLKWSVIESQQVSNHYTTMPEAT